MKKLKQFVRFLLMTLLIVLAMCGMGFLGALFPNHNKYENKPMNVEQKDKREEEEEDDDLRE